MSGRPAVAGPEELPAEDRQLHRAANVQRTNDTAGNSARMPMLPGVVQERDAEILKGASREALDISQNIPAGVSHRRDLP